MKSICRVVCWFLVCSSLVYATDSASPDTAVDTLKGKLVFLRGMEMGDKLNFDTQGVLMSSDSSAAGPFAYSAVEINNERLSDQALELSGYRCALMFGTKSKALSTENLRFVVRSEPVKITIVRDAAHSEALDSAIKTIFALSAEDALTGKSADEIQQDLGTIGSTEPEDEWPSGGDKKAGIFHTGAGVPPPKVLLSVHPADRQVAPTSHKREKFEGTCILSFIVDKNGRPIHIRVARSINPELDTKAVEAMSQYLFSPSIFKGKPVPVRLDMEFNFHIY